MCHSPENSNTKPMLWRGFWKLRANLQRKQRLSRRFRPKTPQNIVRDAWSGVSPVSSLKWKPWLNSRWTKSTVFVLGNSPETSIITLELLKNVALNWKHGGIATVWAVSSDFLFTGKTSCDCETHPDLKINGAAAPLDSVQCEMWLTEGSRRRGFDTARAPRSGDITHTAASGEIQNLSLSLYYSVGPLKFKAAWIFGDGQRRWGQRVTAGGTVSLLK